MKILRQLPPDFSQITKKFKIGPNTVFTYGDVLYNPAGFEISTALLKHEETHSRQQALTTVQKWWKKYLADDKFRLAQEVEAYRNQYLYYCKNKKDLFKRAQYLGWLAEDLSGAMYGNIVGFKEAVLLIGAEDSRFINTEYGKQPTTK